MSALYGMILRFAATPTPQPNFDENSVTPGFVGFIATFGVAVLVVLICLDLVRRVRRVRYRDEIRAKLEAERADAERAEAEERPGRDG